MNNKTEKKLTLVRIGIFLGVALIAIAIISDLVWSTLRFSISNIALLYKRGPLHWIILSSPLVLGIVFAYFKRIIEEREKKLSNERNKNQEELNELEQFIEDIDHEDFSDKEHVFQNQHFDNLLQSLKKKLIAKKEEEEKARWIAEGHAKFGEIFRMTTDLTFLSNEVVKHLVKYLKLNQGSIFILDEKGEEKFLMLKSCYAYNKEKFTRKVVAIGEGQVGQCYLENETIILDQVPKNYVKINSGLGEAVPNFVVIVPIRVNEKTEGVIEIASFKPIAEYEIKFIERTCEAFATVIHSIKSNEETTRLLTETKSQTEQLLAQEEEIRQNLEEMHATQEELSRQLKESKTLAERVERREQVMALTTILSETDLAGTITFANDKFCEVSKYTSEELIGRSQNIVRHPDMPKELFKLFWETIKQGNVFRGIVKNRAKDGSHYWVDATIVPIKDHHGKIMKYTGSRYYIEDEELAVKLYNKQADCFGWPRLEPEFCEYA